MEHITFESLLSAKPKVPAKIVIVGAEEDKMLRVVSAATQEGWVKPTLVGGPTLKSFVLQHAPELSDCCVAEADPNGFSDTACELVQDGGFIMKGTVETSNLMRAILRWKSRMMSGQIISHISLLQVPYYDKLFGLSDTSVIITPTLEQKAEIVRLGVQFMQSLGCKCPKVAVLSAIEKLNPAMRDTVDADKLAAMGRDGSLGLCSVDGPVSLDIAIDPAAARIKHYCGMIKGDADLLLAPDLTAGNLLGKSMNYTPNSLFAGFLLGTTIPVALTSRASSAENKLISLKIGAILQGGR